MDLRGIRLAAEIEAIFENDDMHVANLVCSKKRVVRTLFRYSSFKLHVLIDQKTESFRRIAHITVHTLQTGINSKH